MSEKPRALITGVTGQDGSYLAEFLLEQGYEVIGMVRRTSTVAFDRIAPFQDRLTLVSGDMLDEVSLVHILKEYRPREVYNLAAMSFSAGELASEIRRHIPEFECRFEPDERQAIADSWPRAIDDSAARSEWSWMPTYDLAATTVDMLEKLSAQR